MRKDRKQNEKKNGITVRVLSPNKVKVSLGEWGAVKANNLLLDAVASVIWHCFCVLMTKYSTTLSYIMALKSKGAGLTVNFSCGLCVPYLEASASVSSSSASLTWTPNVFAVPITE